MLKVSELVNATDGILLNGDLEKEIKSYKIDSRKIRSGDFFIPIVGENVDGHKFILNAVKCNCVGFFISNMNTIDIDEIKRINSNVVIIKVKDTKQALVDIGIYNRNKHYNIEVVAITGSVGKTSTREMVASVLSQHKDVLVTEKNMNSHIGMPLMTLKLDNQEMAVLEAGIDFVGEMDILNKLLVPDVAIVTNIGTSHIGKFGSQDIIYHEKTKIAKGLKGKKILILNGDDKFLKNYKNPDVKILYYSVNDAKNIVIKDDSIEFDTYIYNNLEHIIVNALGNHNILNSLVAIKVGQIYQVPVDKIKKGISMYKNISRRMEKISFNGITIIDDTYNASPSSMESGLISVSEVKEKRKIAVLADVLELGEYTKELHYKMGEVFKNLDYKVIISYGDNMKYLLENAKKYVKEIYYCKDSIEAEEIVRKIMTKNDIIYFKGSNSMYVNKIVEDLKRDFMN